MQKITIWEVLWWKKGQRCLLRLILLKLSEADHGSCCCLVRWMFSNVKDDSCCNSICWCNKLGREMLPQILCRKRLIGDSSQSGTTKAKMWIKPQNRYLELSDNLLWTFREQTGGILTHHLVQSWLKYKLKVKCSVLYARKDFSNILTQMCFTADIS